jgi:hypothetical protein
MAAQAPPLPRMATIKRLTDAKSIKVWCQNSPSRTFWAGFVLNLL